MSYEILFGEQSLKFNLPTNFEVLNVCSAKEQVAINESLLEKILLEKFLDPIGTKSLKVLIKPTMKIVIVVDDLTRPTPVIKILEPLVNFLLNEMNVPKENLSIIIGLGIHRDMTQEEYQERVGLKIASEIKWKNHQIKNVEEIAKSSLGTKVEINKEFLESDFAIALGTIEPHPFAGFSGGSKAVIPGIAGLKTISTNHKLALTKNATVGKIEHNKLRRDIDEIGEISGLNFIINTLLNSKKEIVDIVVGHPLKAHREGVRISREMFETPIKEPADILIASSNPLFIDTRQSGKCALNNKLAVKKGGSILIASPCPEGMGSMQIEGEQPSRDSVKMLAKLLPKRILLFFIQKIRKYPIEDSINLYLVFKLLARNDLLFANNFELFEIICKK